MPGYWPSWPPVMTNSRTDARRRDAIEKAALALDGVHRSYGGPVPDLTECRYRASVAIAAYEAHLDATAASATDRSVRASYPGRATPSTGIAPATRPHHSGPTEPGS